MPKYDLNLHSAALVIIDMQRAFVEPGYPLAIPSARDSVQGINELTHLSRRQGIPIIWTAQRLQPDASNAGLLRHVMPESTLLTLAAGADGVELYPEMAYDDRDIVIHKPRFSAFYQTELEGVLRSRDIDTLIIVGTVLNVCCESTVRDAFFRDFQVFLPTGLNTTRDHADVGFGPFSADEMSRAVYTSLGNRFAHVIALDALCKALT